MVRRFLPGIQSDIRPVPRATANKTPHLVRVKNRDRRRVPALRQDTRGLPKEWSLDGATAGQSGFLSSWRFRSQVSKTPAAPTPAKPAQSGQCPPVYLPGPRMEMADFL